MKNSVIGELREQENKECISDKEYEILNADIAKFLKKPNLVETILQDIEDNFTGTKKNSKYYSRFVSIIPTLLAMKYALSNRSLVNIKMTDYKAEEGTLMVNGFVFPLSKDIISLLDMYFRMRELVVELSHTNSDYLFLKIDGISYISNNKQKNPDYSTFFFLMRESINTVACKRISYKRIVELVDKGADIKLLSKLTEVTIETIQKICNIDDDRAKSALIGIITEQTDEMQKKEIVPKGTMKCVYCGKIRSADSTNWVLIQPEHSQNKYLACKECKGKDGKYRY